jgi:hypothetical protein
MERRETSETRSRSPRVCLSYGLRQLLTEPAVDDQRLTLTTQVPFSKRYLKYLTKKYLKKSTLRDFIRSVLTSEMRPLIDMVCRVVASSKDTYELRFFNLRCALTRHYHSESDHHMQHKRGRGGVILWCSGTLSHMIDSRLYLLAAESPFLKVPTVITARRLIIDLNWSYLSQVGEPFRSPRSTPM